MSNDLLLEIGVEELPASWILPALEQLKVHSKVLFEKQRIRYKDCRVFGTPRRLGIFLFGVDEKQEEKIIEIIGPPRKVAFDNLNNPTNVAIKFAEGHKVNVSDLKIKKIPKGEYVYIIKTEGGHKTEKILPGLLKELISSWSWQKSMRWESDFRFARPIRWILALFGDSVIKFNIADVTSGNKSYGHKILKTKPIVIKNISKFETVLRKNFVILDYEERKNLVLEQVFKIASRIKGIPHMNERLIEEVANTIEYPNAILGKYDNKYLDLPEEVLIEVMEKNQKYFPVINKDNKLLPYFIFVENGIGQYHHTVREGNERVLKARFKDGEFFFKEDKKTTLHSKVDKLKLVVFQEELGSVYDKIQRLTMLSEKVKEIFKLSNLDKVKRAIYLCKADLVTDVVKEFPGLQGIIGREYALIDGEPEEVANAICEHYLLPKSTIGLVLSILDKIDTIVGCFSVGLIPTGSQDQYGLRRDALGIINVIFKNNIDIKLKEIIDNSFDTYSNKLKVDKEKVSFDILEFFKGRMQSILLERNIRYDIVNAVLNVNFDNIYLTFIRAEILNNISKRDDFNKIITVFSRVMNILPKSLGFKEIKENLFREEIEKELFTMVKSNENKFLNLIDKKEFDKAFDIISSFSPHIDRFFDKVLVMDKNNDIRNNRLSLLQYINSMFTKIADFSKIVIK
ncbi:MAG: glycine--tRNA ligase subunit beta [Candidatus Firestonebacteria bacterium]